MFCSIQELDWSKHIRLFVFDSRYGEESILFEELATESYLVVLSENLDSANLLGLIFLNRALFVLLVLILLFLIRIHDSVIGAKAHLPSNFDLASLISDEIMRLDLIEFELIAAVDKSHGSNLARSKTLNLAFEVVPAAVSPYHRNQLVRFVQNVLAVSHSRLEEVRDEGVLANGEVICRIDV